MITIKIIRIEDEPYIKFKTECFKNNLTVGQGFTNAVIAWAEELYE